MEDDESTRRSSHTAEERAGRADHQAEEDAIAAARQAVRDLYERGVIDDNHATAALLAIDLGHHRVQRARADATPAGPGAGSSDT